MPLDQGVLSLCLYTKNLTKAAFKTIEAHKLKDCIVYLLEIIFLLLYRLEFQCFLA